MFDCLRMVLTRKVSIHFNIVNLVMVNYFNIASLHLTGKRFSYQVVKSALIVVHFKPGRGNKHRNRDSHIKR